MSLDPLTKLYLLQMLSMYFFHNKNMNPTRIVATLTGFLKGNTKLWDAYLQEKYMNLTIQPT